MFSPSDASPPLFLPKKATVELALDLNLPPTAGYTFFSVELPDESFTSWDVMFDGKVLQEWVEFDEIKSSIRRE